MSEKPELVIEARDGDVLFVLHGLGDEPQPLFRLPPRLAAALIMEVAAALATALRDQDHGA